MANNTGKTVAALLIGAAVGAAVGYIIGTDKEKREEQFDHLKATARKNYNQMRKSYDQVRDKVKDKLSKKAADIQEEIYNDDNS